MIKDFLKRIEEELNEEQRRPSVTTKALRW